MLKIIFFGTPDYVLPILKQVREQVIAVVTQSPKLAGRQKYKSYSPVDSWAHKRNVPIYYDFASLPLADLGIVAAYGKIIPESVISNFRYGILNVHPSLLPKYRGASPVQAAIAEGEKETGVTVIKMDPLMDHGPIVSYFKEEISESDTNEALRERLFKRSAVFLKNLIPAYIDQKVKLKNQDHSKATFTKILKREDGYINLVNEKPEVSERFVRAMYPWPGAWTRVRLSPGGQTKILKILKSHLEDGKLILDKAQLEGKNPVTWKEFTSGYPKSEFVGS